MYKANPETGVGWFLTLPLPTTDRNIVWIACQSMNLLCLPVDPLCVSQTVFGRIILWGVIRLPIELLRFVSLFDRKLLISNFLLGTNHIGGSNYVFFWQLPLWQGAFIRWKGIDRACTCDRSWNPFMKWKTKATKWRNNYGLYVWDVKGIRTLDIEFSTLFALEKIESKWFFKSFTLGYIHNILNEIHYTRMEGKTIKHDCSIVSR